MHTNNIYNIIFIFKQQTFVDKPKLVGNDFQRAFAHDITVVVYMPKVIIFCSVYESPKCLLLGVAL